MLTKEILEKASDLLKIFAKNNFMIATAESCTGGLIIAALTEITGSSRVVDRGFITYSNAAKFDMLGVSDNLINDFGAVSHQVAEKMAQSALDNSNATIAISVTGVAGPGQSENKPAGLVYFACAAKAKKTIVEKVNFTGNRHEVRQKTVLHALDIAIEMANQLIK